MPSWIEDPWRAVPGPVRVLAVVLAVCIVVLSVLGIIHGLVVKIPAFEIGGEIDEGLRFSPIFSALELIGVACAAFYLSILPSERTGVRREVWLALGLLFIFLTADELAEIHERAEDAIGVSWQLLYLPGFVIAIACWLTVLRTLRARSPERALWISGAILAVVTRAIDNIPYSAAKPDVIDLADAAAGLEEVFEYVGNASFLLALAILIHKSVSREDQPKPSLQT